MGVRILIIQESLKDQPGVLPDYKIILDALGYETVACCDANELPEIMKRFDPNLVFWMYPRSKAINNILRQHRQNDDNLKVIWTDDYYGSFVGDSSRYYDDFVVPVVLSSDDFKKIITDYFGKQLL